MTCPRCGMHMVRIHRESIQKLAYSECFKCLECKLNLGRQRPLLQHLHSSFALLYFPRYSRCPQCRSTAVHRLPKRDHIDSLAPNPLGLVQALLHAPPQQVPALPSAVLRLAEAPFRRSRADSHAPGSAPNPLGLERRFEVGRLKLVV